LAFPDTPLRSVSGRYVRSFAFASASSKSVVSTSSTTLFCGGPLRGCSHR